MNRRPPLTFYHLSIVIPRFFFPSFSSLAAAGSSQSSDANSFVSNYLIQTCGLSDKNALSASRRLPRLTSTERPDSVLRILRHYELSDTHIRESIRLFPPILVADDERTLKPAFEFLQGLGLSGPNLGLLVSKNPKLLTVDLAERLIPCIEVLKRLLSNDNKAIIQVLKGCKWIPYKDPRIRLLPNITFLKSCGIVGSQLTTLLKRQPVLFAMSKSKLDDLVDKVIKMDVPVSSRMFVYALYTMSCMTPETLQRKFELLRSYGYSNEDLKYVFRVAPSVLRTSEKKLVSTLDFFTKVVQVEHSHLVRCPNYLMHSLEKRTIPRYKVLQILRSKMLLKKEPSLLYLLMMTEAAFLQYILKFKNYEEELLSAYNG
ncbi:transcription termination factor MTERF8, chloroplastic-like [Aristolochia californica]|uniref:transcription termination factor MTERF8, chloroplastic-like n=1 Tax=Aristolochia californica TaxID=171875 RepID=UPI0035DA0082